MAYKIPRKAMWQLVHAYWEEHYVFRGMGDEEQCRLCGTKGVLEGATLVTIQSRVVKGVEQYCICPRGQTMRLNGERKAYEEG